MDALGISQKNVFSLVLLLFSYIKENTSSKVKVNENPY